jgi:hypothetical protein
VHAAQRTRYTVAAACAAALLISATSSAQPVRAGKLPPLVSTIVEGESMGGVAIGMTEDEVWAQWGKPKRSACHGSSAAEPPGSPGYELGGMVCYWDIARTIKGISDGPVSAFYAPRAISRPELVVRSLTVFRGEVRVPKYRRWKTVGGIGLGSTLDRLKRAYGSKLRKVPFALAAKLPETDRTYYVVTSRDGGKWVTSFSLPTATAHGRERPPAAYLVDRVASIDIMASASFRQYFGNYAPRGWRP